MNTAHPATATILSGSEIVASRAQALKDQIKLALEAGATSVAIDCRELEQIDSVGIGLLIQVHNTLAKAGEALELQNASPDIRQLLTSMRLDKHFRINP